jgi:hypothetical protein
MARLAEVVGVTTTHVVALSGGKDSTALALRLVELGEQDYTFLCTPTGDELPDMLAHWERLERLLGKPLVRITNGTLASWIAEFDALPNWRQRWCTRLLKIEPFLAWIKRNAPCVAYVGLRADEEERRGILSADVDCRFPLREWGWGLAEVRSYLESREVSIPARTDCARCYGQRLSEWWDLWRHHPFVYENAVQDEMRVGATFRSPGRDTRPAALSDLRTQFESGFVPRGARTETDSDDPQACRVCSL